jgi:hypothetical protein
MGTPLYTTDIIPLTSRPTLTVMDDGDYFVILDTSTGKISKILKTNIMTALKITYDNTSGLTAETVQAALDELVVNLGSSDSAILALAGRLDALEGTGYTEGSLKTHEDRLDTLEGTGAGSVKKAIDDLAGAGRTTETVKGNADAIALRELLSNKKSTLLENSETYFPNQRAVNLGLNQTMAEIMGFAPRNLMTVFGTATVAETFAELRARAITGDFRTLRLGDFIDLPSLTIGADSVNPTVYPARTINNDYNQLRMEIVGFDDYYYVGNTAYPTQHHVTMMFKDIPTLAPFNETNITTGDYPGSMLFHWLHEQIEPALISAIGLTPRPVDRMIGTVASSDWAGSETIFLPTNVNIFGTTGFSHTDYGTGTQTQFALFAMNPSRKIKKLNGFRVSWWIAEPTANSSTHFCIAYYYSNADTNSASLARGVVPAFLI